MHPITMMYIQAAASAWQPGEMAAGALSIAAGLAIAFAVYRVVRRVPWPRPFRWRFAAVHVVAAPVAALAWFALASGLQALVPGYVSDVGPRSLLIQFLILGVFFYFLVVGLSYAVEGSARATRAEAVAARTQLAALRAQLHPHFLFNALHAIVQLIPIDPNRAVEAAELVADLLRATIEEQRDEVTLGDEWSFVSRYLAVERIRFGDRLVVRSEISKDLLHECVPAFALQTLVENAVHHGAAPRVGATEIVVTAAGSARELRVTVRNSGDGGTPAAANGAGTGLARLRERLAVLHGSAAKLDAGQTPDGGYEATLVVPRTPMRQS